VYFLPQIIIIRKAEGRLVEIGHMTGSINTCNISHHC